MNRILILEGYRNPFGGPAPRTNQKSLGGRKMARRMSSKMKSQQSKMKSCAASWRKSGKRGSYRAHMKRCLK